MVRSTTPPGALTHTWLSEEFPVRICVICAMVASALLASVAQADPPQRSLPIVDSLDLDDFETNLKADPQFLLLLQAQDRKSSQFGNIIHDANQILGRCALRAGKLADAKTYLLKAGATPGSPQLNSFGPQMLLARELVEKGEKETVLQYLDLVSLFWTPEQEPAEPNQPHEPLIAGWKREISEGKIPVGSQWR